MSKISKITKIGKFVNFKKIARSIADAGARHHERHSPSGFQFAISERLEALSREAWDAVTRDAGIWMSWRYLTILQDTAPENMKLTFAIVLRGAEPVAAVATQRVDISGGRVGVQKLAKQKARVLVCGNLLSWGPHGVAFRSDCDPAELWKGVGECLYRIRRAARLDGQAHLQLIKDIPASRDTELAAVGRLSYRAVETDPDMVLEIPPVWKKYDDYLASLNAKYRRNVRDIMKEVEAAGLALERVENPASMRDEIYNLYLQIHEQAAVRPVTIHKDYIPALAAGLGDDFRCTVLRGPRGLAGFITTIRDGSTAVGYYIGVDRGINDTAPVYHRLLHITISDAIEMRCARLSLGRTALDAKARLGARPVPLCVWTRHRVSALNALMRPILRAVPHGEAPERSPFK